MKWLPRIKNIVVIVVVLIVGAQGYSFINSKLMENKVLKQVIERLEADSRVAEVLVTNVRYDEKLKKPITTIKFLEYDVQGQPLEPKYFDFSGNIIQFQSLVIRFDDKHVRNAHRLKGKSAFLFWKVFMLDGKDTQEYALTSVNTIPAGYKIEEPQGVYEKTMWEEFWALAFDEEERKAKGVKNVQIEAPGTVFIPGYIYTINIEHDGGLRIDTTPISPILSGERVLI